MKTKEKKKLSVITIICIVLITLLMPIFIVNCTLIIKGWINPNEVPSIFGISPLAVETNSMEPLFSGGDLIFIKKADVDSLQVDDVISFYDQSSDNHSVIVTHRIVGIVKEDNESRSFKTKGDANNIADSSLVNEDDVIGKYFWKVKVVGNLVMFLSTTNGIFFCVVVPLVAFFTIDFIIKMIFDKKKQLKE